MYASWSGASLRDVLKEAGINLNRTSQKHIVFEGSDLGPDGKPYGASIPIELAKMMQDDILIAYEVSFYVLSNKNQVINGDEKNLNLSSFLFKYID